MPALQTASASGSVSQFGGSAYITATCPAGTRPVHASFSVGAGSYYNAFRVTAFVPSSAGWSLGVVNTSIAPGPASIYVTVYCAAIP